MLQLTKSSIVFTYPNHNYWYCNTQNYVQYKYWQLINSVVGTYM